MNKNGFLSKRYSTLSRYLVSLTGVVFAYLIYANTIAPMIEGSGPSRGQPAAEFFPNGDTFDPADYFPEGAWERQQCKILRTKQGYLLFKDYQPYDDGRVDVHPVSMVIPSTSLGGKSSKESPIILKAPDGAQLFFDRRVTIGGGFGKFQEGELIGDIKIIRNDPRLPKKDQFEIRTSNVRLTRDQVVTRAPVEFQFGAHYGRGQDLVIKLSQQVVPKKGKSTSNITEIRLNQVDEIVIDNRESKSIVGQPAANTTKPKTDFDQAHFQVVCRGPLSYLAAKETLTLNDQVVATRLDIPGDSMKCASLTLVFEPKPAAKSDSSARTGSNPSNSIRRMIARGGPAVIDMRSQDVFLQAADINLDIKDSIANLVGPELFIQQKDWEFTGKAIQYAINEDGSIGNAIANGPGRMVQTRRPAAGSAGEQRTATFVTEFAGKLAIQPHENKKLVSLTGGAMVRFDAENSLTADEIHLWIYETRVRALSSDSSPKKNKWKWDPAKLLAQGQVQIASRQINGNTKQLTATWDPPAGEHLESTPATEQTGATALSPVLTDRNAERLPQDKKKPEKIFFVSDQVELQFRHTKKGRSQQSTTRNDSNSRKTKTLAKFKKVVLKQNVAVSDEKAGWSPRASFGPPTKQPLVIRGDQVLITPTDDGSDKQPTKFRVEISRTSHFASLSSDGVFIYGNPIFYDQSAGRAWVQGPGQIDLTTTTRFGDPLGNNAELSTPNAANERFPLGGEDNSAELANVASKTQDVKINWLGGMVFDGRQLYFEHQVSANVTRTEPKDKSKTVATSRSSALTLVLDREIDLSDPKGFSPKKSPKIEKMILANAELLDDNTAVFKSFWQDTPTADPRQAIPPAQIEVGNQSIRANGQIQSIQILRVPSAIAYGFSGDIQARGPGFIQVWHRGDSSSPFRPASDRAQLQTPPLTFTQVNFDGNLRGNSKEKSLKLSGNVRAIHSPAKSFQQTFDPDRQETLSESAVRMLCESMQMNQWQPRSSAKSQIEMVASGNTTVQSQKFSATGNRVRYNQAGEQVIIEGASPNFAQLIHRKSIHERPNEVVASKFTYFIRSQTYQAENVKRGRATFNDRGQPGSGRLPNR